MGFFSFITVSPDAAIHAMNAPVILGLLLGYLMLMLCFGFWKPGGDASRIPDATARFYTHPGFLGTFGLALSFAATWFGASSTKAIMDKYATEGLGALWYIAAPSMLTMLLVSMCIGKRVQQLPFLTLPEAIEAHYGRIGRSVLAAVIMVSGTTTLASQLVASLQVSRYLLGETLGLPVLLALYGAVVLYSMFGGFFAVAFTDTVQCLLMLVAIGSLLGFVGVAAGTDWHTHQAIWAAKPAVFWNPLPDPFKAFTLAVVFALPWAIAPEMWQRMKACATPQQASRVGRMAFGLIAFLSLCVLGIAILSLPLFLGRANIVQESNTLLWLVERLPFGWWQGLVILGFFSAVTSTMDSTLSIASQSFTYDLIKRFCLPEAPWKQLCWFNHGILTVVACISVLIALRFTDVITVLWLSADIMACTMVVPVFAILFTARPHRHAGQWAMLSGLACVTITAVKQLTSLPLPFWPDAPYSTLIGLVLTGLVYSSITYAPAARKPTHPGPHHVE
jgi:solute:Na+ symporter, SSS family